jgi:hypothetical protein
MESDYLGASLETTRGSHLLFEMHRARAKHHQKQLETRSKTSDSEQLSESGLRMMDLLRTRRGLDVTYPKDMVFAHLGFVSDGPDLGRRIGYSMSCAQVYNFVARHIIHRGLHEELFSQLDDVKPSVRLHGLCSWAPDWSTPAKAEIPMSSK